MNKPVNMLSTVTPWEAVAEGYAETTMKVFRGYAEKAIKLAKITPQCNILDIACGPGTLSLLAKDQARSIQAVDFSKAMIGILNRSITTNSIKNINTMCCDAQDLPFQDESYDAAFSMFGLMFFPDRQRGYAEVYRTLKPRGKVIISSWAPIAQSPAMQIMFGAMRAMKPELSEPQSDLESLENPEFFKQELINAGFKEVEIHLISETFPVESVDDFWQGILKGSAPIVMMKNSMSSIEWQEKERVALAFLHENIGTLPTGLSSDAWLAYGVK